MPIKKKSDRQLFGANLRQQRQNAGLSQEALAHLADLDRTFVSSVERGMRNISLENIMKLSRALKIEAAELMPELVTRKTKSH